MHSRHPGPSRIRRVQHILRKWRSLGTNSYLRTCALASLCSRYSSLWLLRRIRNLTSNLIRNLNLIIIHRPNHSLCLSHHIRPSLLLMPSINSDKPLRSPRPSLSNTHHSQQPRRCMPGNTRRASC